MKVPVQGSLSLGCGDALTIAPHLHMLDLQCYQMRYTIVGTGCRSLLLTGDACTQVAHIVPPPAHAIKLGQMLELDLLLILCMPACGLGKLCHAS